MFQPNLLRDKRILITGGGTGLGKGMAHRFLELGATVYICGRRTHVLSETETELSGAAAGKIRSLPCDIRDLPRVEQMIDSIWKDGPLDILVNNAAGNFLARTEELSPGAFEAVLGIVLMGTINATMACGRRWLQAAHPGVVLNIAATYSSTGLSLCCAFGDGESWSGRSYPQSGRGMGKPWYPHERDRSRSDSHRGGILPLATAAGARTICPRSKSAAPLRHHRRVSESGCIPGE